MKNCHDWEEILWLDVYKELGPEEQLQWKKHLETCNACDQERKRLMHLLENVREAMPEPVLSHVKHQVLHNTIKLKLKGAQGRSWWRQPLWILNIKPIHVLAACCILILTFGWFSLTGVQPTGPAKINSDIGVKEKLMVKDMDILEHLELLEDMDTLQKLDQVMRKKKTVI